MSRHFKKKNAVVAIQGFSSKGNGIGFYLRGEGEKSEAEIPFTMPGEKVNAWLTRKQKGRSQGVLEEIIDPSPERISPARCVHFGSCGGCRWQHIPYPQQLAIKENWIRNHFAAFLTPQVAFDSIIGCEPPWQYRNKMEFSFSNNAEGTKFLGLIQDSSRGRVLNLTECHLVNPWFIEALTAVRKWWMESNLMAYHASKNSGSLRTLTLREGMRTGDRLAMLTVSGNPEYALKQNQLDSLVAFLREAIEPDNPQSQLSLFLRIQQISKGMATQFYEMHLYGSDHLRENMQIFYDTELPAASFQFHVSPSAFFQPNTRQAERLYSHSLQLAKIPKQGIIYDLYCGTGTLAICASKIASEVIGIELSPESSLDARENAKLNKCENIKIITGDVGMVLQEMHSRPEAELVIVDPPRAGLDERALKHLLQLKPAKILYVSCNPQTQAANCHELVKRGYHLTHLQPVDQFPQTPHMENIAILVRE